MEPRHAPTVDEIAETTDQTKDQRRKDRVAAVEMALKSVAYDMMEARYGSEDFESARENAVDPREMRSGSDS